MALLYLFEDAYDRSEFCILPLFSNCCRVLIFNISHVPQGPRPQQHLEGYSFAGCVRAHRYLGVVMDHGSSGLFTAQQGL